ncbi:MAG TPA: ribosomal protein S18-alanine N-acetyltransferase [Gemmatimonadaceae bacterium]|nr:ribosomal protein S18-alanine N-acetyltransferase [Gemmatimonadaceae bacterium]
MQDGGSPRSDGTPVAIRAACAMDLSAVRRIEQGSFADPWGAAEFRSVLESPHTIFLVAVSHPDEAVIGYAIGLTVLDESEILNIAVDPESRQRGVGGRLLDATIAEARGRGAVAAFLEVRESNSAARELYRSRGFESLSRRRDYYRAPVEDALVLRLAMQ